MINVSFDMYSDTPAGKDPDQWSSTLRRYHALLWSKPLPDGRCFTLSTTTRGAYLHHSSEQREFFLSSDSIGHTYRNSKPVADVISQVPEDELDAFFTLASTIGAYTIFPARTVNRKPTINGARGMHPKIGDRFDLTLECIRLHYAGGESPLSAVLARYETFFHLFGDFEGYVDFFLFQDLINPETGRTNFFLRFTDFKSSPYPNDIDAYRVYRDAVTSFITARNIRIAEASPNP